MNCVCGWLYIAATPTRHINCVASLPLFSSRPDKVYRPAAAPATVRVDGGETTDAKMKAPQVSRRKERITADGTAQKPAVQLISETFVALEAAEPKGGFENPLGSWRRRFVSDTPDPVWSQMAEMQAASSLFGRLGPDIELIGIHCGSQVCEVEAASTSAENSEIAANRWQENMSTMTKESWWSAYDFSVPNSAIWSAPDGRALIVSYLTRESQSR
jgi:hypothetical protein